MREIKYIAIHCTATSQSATVQSILKFWKEKRGWTNPGYHFLIEPNGIVHNLQPIDKHSNGVAGFNHCTINIAYIGGIDEKGNPVDNRTEIQKKRMLEILNQLKIQFPNAKIRGHRDFPNVKKACPSFSVSTWLSETAPHLS